MNNIKRNVTVRAVMNKTSKLVTKVVNKRLCKQHYPRVYIENIRMEKNIQPISFQNSSKC